MKHPQPVRRSDPTPCTHCGLPVPAPLLREQDAEQFCCEGCRTVFAVIAASGFEAYYQMREQAPGQPAPSVGRGYEELDDPAFLERWTTPAPDGQRKALLHLEGVHCSACLWLVEKALTRLDGVSEARLDFGRSRLSLRFHPGVVRLSRVAQELARLGYPPHPAKQADAGRTAETRRLLIRIGVAGAVAGNVMLMAFALYGGAFSGMAGEHRDFFRWMSLVASLPGVLYAAWPFYRSAFAGLRAGVLHMDLPISIGILAGFVSGVLNTVRGEGEIYFDSVTVLIFLLLVGRLLQLRQQRLATESSELLHALTPSWARRLDAQGQAQRIPLEAIAPGDRLEVRPNEILPADGRVRSGRSSVDASLLSGESVPVGVRVGDEVFAGTRNLEDVLVIEAATSTDDSRVARLADLVESAHSLRAPVVQLADRIAGWFVAAVLGLALLTLAAWSVLDPAVAIDHAVALLVVSCPCALGLATPLALTAAMGKAARAGILVRSGGALEALGRPQEVRPVLFFDKTGTLTHGRLEVLEAEGPDWLWPLVAGAERDSVHPVGRALRALSDAPVAASTIETVHGAGIVARVGEHELVVGKPDFVSARSLRAPELDARSAAFAERALTPVWVAVDGRVRGLLGLADRIRSEARDSVAALRARGFDVHLLSGDAPAVARAVGRQLDLPPEACEGGADPETKLERVEAAAARGPVVMVGDGVNDAAALAAATVGVAVHGGAEVALSAADVFLSRSGVSPVVELIEGARRTYGVLRRNIVFSLVYNAFGASLAVSGLLDPLVAAVLMPLSSLVVVTSSFRFQFVDRADHERRS